MKQIVIDAGHSLISGYQHQAPLRSAFNALSQAVFGLDFEGWYQQGHWQDNYTAYSILRGDQVIANVSVSPMEFICDGHPLRLLQLGTVMTRPDQRGAGWIRRLMAEVELDWADRCEGMFLYANDAVTGLYPKFGFQEAVEEEYWQDAQDFGQGQARRADLADPAVRADLAQAIQGSALQSRLQLREPAPLVFFYISQFLADCVYHIPNLDAWAIAELEGDELLLHQVFAPASLDPGEVIRALGGSRRVRLGFTPLHPRGLQPRPIREADSTFFVKGSWAQRLTRLRLRIPSLAHT